MMARRLGPGRVVVGRRRHAAALRALALDPAPDLLIMDDGFQHRALRRDLDLLLLDGVRTWGNGRMLPLGDLREPMASAARASCLVVTRGGRADRSRILAWWAPLGLRRPGVLAGLQPSAPCAGSAPGSAWNCRRPPPGPCSPSAPWATPAPSTPTSWWRACPGPAPGVSGTTRP